MSVLECVVVIIVAFVVFAARDQLVELVVLLGAGVVLAGLAASMSVLFLLATVGDLLAAVFRRGRK